MWLAVGAFYPATGKSGLDKAVLDHLVGVDDEAFGIWHTRAEKNTGHALADAVLDAVARVYDQGAGVLEALEALDRAELAAHVDDDVLGHTRRCELLLGVYVDLAAALAELVGHQIEDGGVVADMIGRENA